VKLTFFFIIIIIINLCLVLPMIMNLSREKLSQACVGHYKGADMFHDHKFLVSY